MNLFVWQKSSHYCAAVYNYELVSYSGYGTAAMPACMMMNFMILDMIPHQCK